MVVHEIQKKTITTYMYVYKELEGCCQIVRAKPTTSEKEDKAAS